MADAVLIESAWVGLFNEKHKGLLRFHYCQRRSKWFIRRRLRINDYDEALMFAHAAIMRAIDRKDGNHDKKACSRLDYNYMQITDYASSVHQPV